MDAVQARLFKHTVKRLARVMHTPLFNAFSPHQVHTEVGGAFITSDSWAAAGEAYNAMSAGSLAVVLTDVLGCYLGPFTVARHRVFTFAGFDLFLWTNPMVASFLAAGNEGGYLVRGRPCALPATGHAGMPLGTRPWRGMALRHA